MLRWQANAHQTASNGIKPFDAVLELDVWGKERVEGGPWASGLSVGRV